MVNRVTNFSPPLPRSPGPPPWTGTLARSSRSC